MEKVYTVGINHLQHMNPIYGVFSAGSVLNYVASSLVFLLNKHCKQ